MAVLIEGYGVVLTPGFLQSKGFTPAQWSALLRGAPQCSDGSLIAVHLSSPREANSFVRILEGMGWVAQRDGTSIDMALVDVWQGFLYRTPWLEFARIPYPGSDLHVAVCRLPGEHAGVIAVPDDWDSERSLTRQVQVTIPEQRAPSTMMNPRRDPAARPLVAEIFVLHSQMLGGPAVEMDEDLDMDDEEAEAEWERVLEPYNDRPWGVLRGHAATCKQAGYPMPFAIIALDRAYPIMQHLISIRKDRADFYIGAIGEERRKPKVDGSLPSAGEIVVFRKSAVGELAAQSPIMAAAWQALRHREEDRHWLCLLGPLDKEWVAARAAEDNALDQQHRQA